jgi:hypothetical protein
MLQAQSKHIARKGLQKDRPQTVKVTMAVWKHSNLLGSHDHIAPGYQIGVSAV